MDKIRIIYKNKLFPNFYESINKKKKDILHFHLI